MERRLAAIVATDVVGYSRLIRADEEGTLAAIKALRADVIDPKIAEHNGRIVKLMGDGMLAEFASVVDAVRAAVEAQLAIAEQNADLPEDRRIEFRVGINLGDVVIDGDDIHGDGVNVAARLEGLSEAGGICISGKVYEEVRDRTNLAFEDMGEQMVKNIDRPVRVWRWAAGAPSRAAAALAPDKPSIAVLAFDNMSGDPEQEYFSDGIAEDIITDLSKFSWLTVISRNSSFSFKGRSLDLRAIAAELNVRYLLEGSVRKSGNRLRITAQLIDASDGGHIWAERYDRQLDDIFDLQDEMTRAITAAIGPELEALEIRRSFDKGGRDLDAWDLTKRAQAKAATLTQRGLLEALKLSERALEIGGENSDTLGVFAQINSFIALGGWSASQADNANKAIEAARRALSTNPNDINALTARAQCEAILGRHEQAVLTARQCVRINPNEPLGHAVLAIVLVFNGDYEEAVRAAEAGYNLSHRSVALPSLFYALSLAHLANGNSDRAITWCERTVQEFPKFPIAQLHAIACIENGELDRAKDVIARLRQLAPKASIGLFMNIFPGKDPQFRARYESGLRKAGLPEST